MESTMITLANTTTATTRRFSNKQLRAAIKRLEQVGFEFPEVEPTEADITWAREKASWFKTPPTEETILRMATRQAEWAWFESHCGIPVYPGPVVGAPEGASLEDLLNAAFVEPPKMTREEYKALRAERKAAREAAKAKAPAAPEKPAKAPAAAPAASPPRNNGRRVARRRANNVPEIAPPEMDRATALANLLKAGVDPAVAMEALGL